MFHLTWREVPSRGPLSAKTLSLTRVSYAHCPGGLPILRAGRIPPLRRVGRDRGCVAIQVAIEPIHLPVEALDQVLQLTGACQVVVLAREEHDLARHTEVLERAEPLLPLLNRHAVIV